MTEEWRPVVGYEGSYEVSSMGTIRSLDRLNGRGSWIKGRLMKPAMTQNGYMSVTLCFKGEQTTHYVHRLVAQAFVTNPEDKPQVNHINEIKADNRVSNLEWVTPRENIVHGTKTQRAAANTDYAKKVANTDYVVIARKLAKAVTATHLRTGEVLDFPSMKEAQRNGFNASHISKCCRGKLAHHKGYVWEYAVDVA